MPRTPILDHTYLGKLQDYFAAHQVFPSYAAIGRIVGLNSTSSVSAMIARLKLQKYLETSKDGRLKPGSRFFERPLMLDKVAAGLPSMVFDAPPESLSIDARLVKKPSKTFLIRVKGDSMEDAGLLPGDTLIVEKAHTAKEGQIVVAILEDAYTVKRLIREGKRFVLKPENKAYPVLRPENLEIVGIVVGSFREYQ